MDPCWLGLIPQLFCSCVITFKTIYSMTFSSPYLAHLPFTHQIWCFLTCRCRTKWSAQHCNRLQRLELMRMMACEGLLLPPGSSDQRSIPKYYEEENHLGNMRIKSLCTTQWTWQENIQLLCGSCIDKFTDVHNPKQLYIFSFWVWCSTFLYLQAQLHSSWFCRSPSPLTTALLRLNSFLLCPKSDFHLNCDVQVHVLHNL